MVRVKICGLKDNSGVDAAVGAGADWIGFNFFARSPRAVTPAQAATLAERAKGGPLLVGLFVDPKDGEVADALRAVRFDVLQLYASEARIAEVKMRFGVQVWRSVPVISRVDLPSVSGEDGLLIEPRPPPGATRPGGNAVTLDWSILAGWQAPSPWLLAGGLLPETVVAAIHASGATAVDVSSGVESAPGMKDPDLIRRFIQAARSAPAEPAAGSVSATPA